MVLFKRVKIWFCLILFVLVNNVVFSADYNVGIYPSNAEIKSYITVYFPYKTYNEEVATIVNKRIAKERDIELGKKLSTAYKEEKSADINNAKSAYFNRSNEPILAVDLNVKVSDINEKFSLDSLKLTKSLAEYLCNKYNYDLIIFPMMEQLSDLNYLTLYTYDTISKEINLIYGEIKQTSDVYGVTALKSLAYLFLEKDEADAFVFELENPSEISESSINFSLTSNVPAEVYVDGVFLGDVEDIPFTFVDKLPISITLKSEGYQNQTSNIVNTNTSNIHIELKPLWMNEFKFYNDAKNDFYWAFTRVLASFALSVASGALNFEDYKIANTIKSVAVGLSVLTIVDMFGNLTDYYRFADYVSP